MAGPQATKGFFRRHAGRFIGSIILTVCVLWGLHHSGISLHDEDPTKVSLVPPWSAYAAVRWWTVPTYLLFVVTFTYFRATRWRFLLRKVGAHIPQRKILGVSFVGFAAILLLPIRLGEFVRPALIREKGKVSFSAATGSIIAERVVDGFYLSVVLAIALLVVPKISPLPERVIGLPVTTKQVIAYAYFTFAGFTGALATIAVYYFARNFAKRATLAVFGLVSKKLAERLAHEAEKVADGLHVLQSFKDALGFMLESTAYWGLNAAGMWFLAWGVGLDATFGQSCAMMGMLGVTILIPGPPGLLGIFQAGMFCGMTLYFPPEEVASKGSVYAFLLFAIQVGWTILAGAVALFAGHGQLSDISRSEVERDDENLAEAPKGV